MSNGRPAHGPHGTRRKGNPNVKPPSVRSARLRPSWSTPEGESERRAPERTVGSLVALMGHARTGFLAPSLRAIGRLACDPHGACQGIGDFIRSSNASTVGWLPAKKITLCWAGAGRTIPASDRRPTGFAGDPRGVYLRDPSRSFNMAVEASFRSRGANQSQAGLVNHA